MRARASIRGKHGVAATEFLIAFPTFLIFSLFVIEVSLMWSDRHVLRLAGFEAARALVTEAHMKNSDAVCWPVDPQNEDEQNRKRDLVSIAKTAAANKIAVIAPTLTYFAAQVPGLSGAASAVDDALGNGQSVSGRYLSAFKRFVLAWPMAYAMTTVSCREDAELVTISIEYMRAPKLPYIGGLLWAIKATQKLNESTGGVVKFSVDSLDYFGVKTDLDSEQVVDKINAARNELKDTIQIMREMSWEEISSSTSPIVGLVASEHLDPIFSRTGEIDRYANSMISTVMNIGGIVQKAGPIATAIVYAVPENLRLIPMKSEIKMSKGMPSNGDPNRHWAGRAFLVSPLTEGGESAWGQWTKRMQEIDE